MRMVDRYRWWWLPAAVVVVSTLALAAWWHAPHTTHHVVIHDATSAEVEVPSEVDSDGLDHWRCQISFRRGARPGPAWTLSSGDSSNGLQLVWDPQRLVLRLHLISAGDLSGAVLGQVTVAHGCDTISLLVRGQRVAILVDGRSHLSTLSPVAMLPARHWRFDAEASTGGAQLTAAALIGRAPTVLDQTAAAVAMALTDPSASNLSAARNQLAALDETDPERERLTAWLDLRKLVSVIATTGADPAMITAGLVRLAASPDGPVLLAEFLPPLIDRALAPERYRNVAAAEALERRQAWLGLVAWIADRIGGEQEAASQLADPVLAWQVALAGHTARVLAGLTTTPTPPRGPRWLTARWRLLRGIASLGPADDTAELEPLSAAQWPGDPLRPALTRLLEAAGLPQQEASIRATIAVRHALEHRLPDQALLAAAGLGDRDRVIMRLLIALGGLPETSSEVLAAVGDDGTDHAVAQRDPLAWALSQLLASTLEPQAAAPVPGDPETSARTIPAGLADQSELLSGNPEATALVFGSEAGTLPPPQALLAALAMQTVAGETPHWDLLRATPDPTLPLDLAIPVAVAPATPSGTTP